MDVLNELPIVNVQPSELPRLVTDPGASVCCPRICLCHDLRMLCRHGLEEGRIIMQMEYDCD